MHTLGPLRVAVLSWSPKKPSWFACCITGIANRTRKETCFCHQVHLRFAPAEAAESCPPGNWSNLLMLSNHINVRQFFFLPMSIHCGRLLKGNLLFHAVQYLIKTRDVFLLSQHVLKLIVAPWMKRTPPPPFFLCYCRTDCLCMQRPPPGFKGRTCDNCQRIKAIYRSHVEHMADPPGLASLFHLG